MEAFEYNANPGRVVFGSGTIKKLPSEIKRLGLTRPLLLSTAQQKDQVAQLEPILKDASIASAGLFSNATMHTPTDVTETALAVAKHSGADCVVSFGGGSTTGLGKAISVRTGIPHISIPTTYAGSEMTPILGETAEGRKTTRSDPKILPATVIYDVDFTMTLPAALSATSGVNAIAHAGRSYTQLYRLAVDGKAKDRTVEALYARNTNPVINLMAVEGTKALARSLPIIVEDSHNIAARSDAQYGAWLCGTCLGSVGMALHHKLCHTLGGSFNLPHAETHTIVLPHALAYNAPKIPDVMQKLADVLPEANGDAITGLNVLLSKLKVKRGLKEYGMREEDVDKAVDIAVSNPYWNPRAIEKDPLRETIRRCWAGEDARADL
ncbi:Maleylacetate reductase 1 [Pseudocercospora fuligena]|uniref:Maleylacetate reductase 1 n=1 Tax=Pseudocercospora fuligena TaxID=685502 RepID=A0A8H6RRF1_9PEZI|nr:Maleylacetate reductase 1 [Pseudocercospora fuligena]